MSSSRAFCRLALTTDNIRNVKRGAAPDEQFSKSSGLRTGRKLDSTPSFDVRAHLQRWNFAAREALTFCHPVPGESTSMTHQIAFNPPIESESSAPTTGTSELLSSISPMTSNSNGNSLQLPTTDSSNKTALATVSASSRLKRVMAEKQRHRRKCKSMRDRLLLQQLEDEFALRGEEKKSCDIKVGSVRNIMKPMEHKNKPAARKRKVAQSPPTKHFRVGSPTPSTSGSRILVTRCSEADVHAQWEPSASSGAGLSDHVHGVAAKSAV